MLYDYKPSEAAVPLTAKLARLRCSLFFLRPCRPWESSDGTLGN